MTNAGAGRQGNSWELWIDGCKLAKGEAAQRFLGQQKQNRHVTRTAAEGYASTQGN